MHRKLTTVKVSQRSQKSSMFTRNNQVDKDSLLISQYGLNLWRPEVDMSLSVKLREVLCRRNISQE